MNFEKYSKKQINKQTKNPTNQNPKIVAAVTWIIENSHGISLTMLNSLVRIVAKKP